MILDAQAILSDQQTIALSFSATPVLSTNTIDLGAAPTLPLAGPSGTALTARKDVGRGNPPELLVQITETVTSAGAATVQVQLITSASANLGTPTVIQSTAAIALATLVAGYQFRLAIPPGIAQRYLGVQYIIGVADTTAGKVTAGIVEGKQTTTV